MREDSSAIRSSVDSAMVSRTICFPGVGVSSVDAGSRSVGSGGSFVPIGRAYR